MGTIPTDEPGSTTTGQRRRREVRPPRTRLGRRAVADPASGPDNGGPRRGRRPRIREPRHFGEPQSKWSRRLSPVLIALVMVAGAVLGVKLSRDTGPSEEKLAGPPTEAIVVNGHRYLWGKITPPEHGRLYWGAFRLGAPYRTKLVSGLEQEVGIRPAVMMWYQEWAGQPDFPVAPVDWLFKRGIVPMITWEPWKPPKVFGTVVNDQPKFSLQRIADGAWDGYISRYARQIARYGGPVILRPMHEMDGSWYPWSGTAQRAAGNSPTEFKKAWRHIWRVFRDAGATNVTWMWSVNHVSLPATPENQIRNYWPGKKFVDWIGFSGFNWGTSSPFGVWKGFDAVERARYDDLATYGRPIAITEMGAPEQGGDKAKWIHDSFRDIRRHYPKLQMLVWYDKQDTAVREWQIDSSPESLAAFREEIGNPRVLDADAALGTAKPHVPR
ncbi:MAG: glycoside hydrolase family 26 protein [Actinomycetota bacterium]